MPIFSRRQLQNALDDLSCALPPSKAKDLVKRLDHRNPDQALPAEYELVLTWGVAQVAELEIDRPAGNRKPDIWSPDLLPGGPVFIDIAGVSDHPFSDELHMRRAANIINNFCGQLNREAPKHLHYQFLEQQTYLPADRYSFGQRRFVRQRLIEPDFSLDENLRAKISDWLSLGTPQTPLRLISNAIGVEMSWRDLAHPSLNVFSSMPSEVYDLTDNGLYSTLKSKAKQLRDVPQGTKRGIFLGDTGCALLRKLRPFGGQRRDFSGQQIIQHFLSNSEVDFVAVFSPERANQFAPAYQNPVVWNLTILTKSHTANAEFSKLMRVRYLLPSPLLPGYQARSLHEQKFFAPQGRGQYLPPSWTSGYGRGKVKISARGLLELLSGRLKPDDFEKWITGERNLFEGQLAFGKMLSNVTFEPKGDDEDDDYVVFEFSPDPAASLLRAPNFSKKPGPTT